VVGDTRVDRNYSNRILRLIERWQLDNKVELCGVMDDSQLARLLRTSHVLCVPSSYEGFGIAYLEGMGFGLPAIATIAGAAGEIITHGQEGFLVSTGDAATLASYLAVLATDRQRLASMGLAARRRFLAHPTWDQTAASIREFLSGLVDSSRIYESTTFQE
jgi:glycosyltransferase involved in cell wall biosynthesis